MQSDTPFVCLRQIDGPLQEVHLIPRRSRQLPSGRSRAAEAARRRSTQPLMSIDSNEATLSKVGRESSLWKRRVLGIYPLLARHCSNKAVKIVPGVWKANRMGMAGCRGKYAGTLSGAQEACDGARLQIASIQGKSETGYPYHEASLVARGEAVMMGNGVDRLKQKKDVNSGQCFLLS